MSTTPRPSSLRREPGRIDETLLVRIRVGFEPRVIVISAGEELVLELLRETASACAERFVFPAFGVDLRLPVGEPVKIVLPPVPPGEYPFGCGLGMKRGRLIAR